MIDGLTLRELEPGDLEAVAVIEASASPDPWSYDLFAGELTMPAARRHWLVAMDGPALVGFAGMMYVPDGDGPSGEGHLMNIAVDPTRTRQGIASKLLVALFLDAVGRGTRHLTLEVRVSNEAARVLYRRFGFAPVGVRPRYYPDGEDALILWAHDIRAGEFVERLDALGASRTKPISEVTP